MTGINIRLKLNKRVWLVLIPLLFGMGSILRMSGLLGYTADYMVALKMSMENSVRGSWGGFYAVGRIFHAINIFGIETLNGWSFFLIVIFMPIIYCYCRNLSTLSLAKLVFACGFIAFFSACACNISKEAVQAFVFILIDMVAFSKAITNKTLKFILIFLLFLCNGLMLRKYFYLVAVVFAIFGMTYILSRKAKKILLSRDMLFFFFFGFLALTIARTITPSLYYQVANTRESLLHTYGHANTLIKNMVSIHNFEFNWLVNYAITSLRILFPVEFMFRGIKYIPFVIVQVIFSLNLVKGYGENNYKTENYRFAYFALLSFIIVELVWEVDLGTMFRHETSAIALIISVILKNDSSAEKKERKRCLVKI